MASFHWGCFSFFSAPSLFSMKLLLLSVLCLYIVSQLLVFFPAFFMYSVYQCMRPYAACFASVDVWCSVWCGGGGRGLSFWLKKFTLSSKKRKNIGHSCKWTLYTTPQKDACGRTYLKMFSCAQHNEMWRTHYNIG